MSHKILTVGFWYLPHPILRECCAIPSYDLYEKTSLVAHSVKNLPAMQKTQVRFLGQEEPL